MQHTTLSTKVVTLSGLSNINIVLGRNGSGKSKFLRSLDTELTTSSEFNVRYLSPERNGVFRLDGNVQNNMQDQRWLRTNRRKNQADNFKAVSANLLRDVELIYLRKLQDSPELRLDITRNFRVDRLERINRLLTNVSVELASNGVVFRNYLNEVVPPDEISSGESEAVALATEIMYFFETVDSSRFNLLLIDEPDVHLHPDLQARLAQFLVAEIEGLPVEVRPKAAICLATHSTPLVCALATSPYTTIGTKDFGSSHVHQIRATDQLKKVAPFFGHPLSLSLSSDAMLIVEGEDDERVWQQAARSSQGRIRLFPVLATSVDQLSELENFCGSLLSVLYDSPVAYSLRDGDGISGDLCPTGPVIRFRLQCYAMENALLTDDCLRILGTTWEKFQKFAVQWLQNNQDHRDKDLLKQLIDSPSRMRNEKIKSLRQLICSIADSQKPWEVVVGQAIGNIDPAASDFGPTSLISFLGADAMRTLLNVHSAQ